jgi:hypothetical protein
MKIPKIVILIIVVVVIGIVALSAYLLVLNSSNNSSNVWLSAAEYPVQLNGLYGVGGNQCLNSASSIVCIGGQDVNGGPRNEVYISSAVSSSSPNVTSWTASSNVYPVVNNGQACATYSGYVYCVGGSYDDEGDDTASSYYAQLGSGGTIGSWTNTTAYPIPVDTEYCVTSSGYIYCVGGNNETDGTTSDSTMANSVWYANVSSSGIGAWKPTSAYPLYYPSCYSSSDYVYCIGGTDSSQNPISTSYYAQLTPTGISQWTQTTSYPTSLSGQACAISGTYIYCVGGEGSTNSYSISVYYAQISSSGIGTWKSASNYPDEVLTNCVITSGSLYCIGGFDGSSAGETAATYYVPLSTLNGSSSG